MNDRTSTRKFSYNHLHGNVDTTQSHYATKYDDVHNITKLSRNVTWNLSVQQHILMLNYSSFVERHLSNVLKEDTYIGLQSWALAWVRGGGAYWLGVKEDWKDMLGWAVKQKNIFYIVVRGVKIHFNNDTMCTTIHGWWYNTRTISAHLEQYNMIWFND